MATIIPFPITRRRSFIRKHACRALDLPAVTAEKHIRHQLKVQMDTMARRGVDAERIGVEVNAAETAIRAEMVRMMLVPGDVAR